jgi:hypothetical protein
VIATETFKPLVLAQAKARKVEPIEAATKGLAEATNK